MKIGTLTLNEQEQQELLKICDVAIKALGLSNKQMITNAIILADKISAVEMAYPTMVVEEEELSK